MPVIGFAVVWLGYTGIMYSYCLLRGYNVSLKQLVSPVNWYSGKWPPAKAGNAVIFPDGTSASLIQLDVASLTQTPPGTTATGTSGGSAGTNLAGASGGGTAAKNQAIAKKIIAANPSFNGWDSGNQWASLVKLWDQESGWNANATNPSSGAYGIPQSLHGTRGGKGGNMFNASAAYGLKAAQLKLANEGNAAAQIAWGLRYIQSQYGTPAGAWAQETSQGWY